MKSALILVDIQNDFLPGGALAVPNGDEVIAVANAASGFDLIIATQDWHPSDHLSFALQHPGKMPGDMVSLEGLPQVLWPVHCVKGSRGAQFAETLDMERVTKVFNKGTDRSIDSYSGFFDNGKKKATGLGEYLEAEGVDRVTVLGLATDYCVKATAIDALELGFATTLIASGCRAVDLAKGDGEKAIAEMRKRGITIA